MIPFITLKHLRLPLLPTKLLMQPLNISLFIVGNILLYCFILPVQCRFYEKKDGWRKNRNLYFSNCKKKSECEQFSCGSHFPVKGECFLKSLTILRLARNTGLHKKGWASYALGWTSKVYAVSDWHVPFFSYFDAVTCLTHKLSVRLKSFHNLPPTLLAGTCALKIWQPVPLVDIILWCSAYTTVPKPIKS